jgi:peptidoglycan-N-acetylmuramic acid deacetylase
VNTKGDDKLKKILFIVFALMFLIAVPNVNAKSYGWGFKRNDDHQTPEIGIYAQEIEGTSSYYIGNPNKKIVYLTFDVGYDNGTLEKLLKVLEDKEVKATFFVTGDFITREEELLKKIVEAGHIIGNHTWGHKDITKLSFTELREQLTKVEDRYQELFGEEMYKFFRPPEGTFNKQSLENVEKLGYTTFFWSIAFRDWDVNRGKEFVVDAIINNLHNGAIILLHTVSAGNIEALPEVIDQIRSNGYSIKNLDYLISSEGFTF